MAGNRAAKPSEDSLSNRPAPRRRSPSNLKREEKNIVIQRSRFASSGRPSEHQAARLEIDFLAAHLNAAYNLARWLMRNEAEAEDVVQEAYLSASSDLAGFQGGDGRAWLLAIVRNSCYDHLRQKGASGQHTDFDEAARSAGHQTLNPETPLPLTERTDVTKSLAELPAEYREVLVLRELERLSYREIAKIAGIPPGTVMSHLSRARQQLRQSLSD